MRPIVKAGLVGAAAYALWPKGFAGGAHPPANPAAAPRETDWSKVKMPWVVGDALTSSGGSYVLTDNQPRPVSYAAEKATAGTIEGAKGGFYQQFRDQVELPAGRVVISDLQPYHFQLANAMLAGGCARADEAGRLYQDVLKLIAFNKKTADDLQIANSTISAIASFIPVIGGALKLAVGTGLGEGVKGHTQNALNEAQALAGLAEIKSGLGVGSPEGRMWLSNSDSTAPPDPQYIYGTDLYTTGLATQGGYYAGPDGLWLPPDQALQQSADSNQFVNGVKAIRYERKPGITFVPVGGRMRWFAMHRYGWILPWLSPQLGVNDGPDVMISIISPVLRALDLMAAMMDPMMTPADGKPSSFRYWYTSPVMGNVMGACLPPTKEDTQLVIAGKRYSFSGVDVTDIYLRQISTVSQRGKLDTGISSVVIPNQGAQQGTGEAQSGGEIYTNSSEQVASNKLSSLTTFKGFK